MANQAMDYHALFQASDQLYREHQYDRAAANYLTLTKNPKTHDFVECETNEAWDIIMMGDVLEQCGMVPIDYQISAHYNGSMEVIAMKAEDLRGS